MSRQSGFGRAAIAGACVVVIALLPTALWAQSTERISVSSSGAQGNGPSYGATISADGHYVAFCSKAGNLVDGDTNGLYDIFVRDLTTGVTERVSVASDGTQGNGHSAGTPSISADGRFVAFYSTASNLVPIDTNHCGDVFVRDRELGTTDLVSVSSGGIEGNGTSMYPSISADGRYVAFASLANNLVWTFDYNNTWDVFVRDTITSETMLVSTNPSGIAANGQSWLPSISADGQRIAYISSATDLVAGDTNNSADIFVFDAATWTNQRVSVSSTGAQANNSSESPSISADGRYVVFASNASNLVSGDGNKVEDVFLFDLTAGTTVMLSRANDGSAAGSWSGFDGSTSISADGRFVCFTTDAGALTGSVDSPDSQVIVRDRTAGTNEVISVATDGGLGNDGSWAAVISGDGHSVVFGSSASNLVSQDTNDVADTFVRHRVAGLTSLSGRVTFEGLSPVAAAPPAVEVSMRLNGVAVGNWEVGLGPDGSFSRAMPAGHLTLSFKVLHWLRKTVTVDTSSGDAQMPDIQLLNGDANGDNHVGIGDLSWVLLWYGSWEPMADLDGNGIVGLGDISQILLNFGLAGDP